MAKPQATITAQISELQAIDREVENVEKIAGGVRKSIAEAARGLTQIFDLMQPSKK